MGPQEEGHGRERRHKRKAKNQQKEIRGATVSRRGRLGPSGEGADPRRGGERERQLKVHSVGAHVSKGKTERLEEGEAEGGQYVSGPL